MVIIASSPFDCCAIDVTVQGIAISGSNTTYLVDIGTGGAGSETVLVDGIPFFGHGAPLSFRVPVRKPAGTRFVWRMQAAVGGLTPAPSNPAVSIGFVRDIPEFLAGTTCVTVPTTNRTTSQANTLSSLAAAQKRRVWAYLGDVPAGRMLYGIPFVSSAGTSVADAFQRSDFGWGTYPSGVYSAGDAVPTPDEVWIGGIATLTTSTEEWSPNIQTVQIRDDGYIGGGLCVAVDAGVNGAARDIVVLAVMA